MDQKELNKDALIQNIEAKYKLTKLVIVSNYILMPFLIIFYFVSKIYNIAFLRESTLIILVISILVVNVILHIFTIKKSAGTTIDYENKKLKLHGSDF